MKHLTNLAKLSTGEHSLEEVLRMSGMNETNIKIAELKGWLKKTIVCPSCLRPTEPKRMSGFECLSCDKKRGELF